MTTSDTKTQLILVRHGESLWNHANLFTGWADIGLTERGVSQMQELAAMLQGRGLIPDRFHTSQLQRCRVSQQLLIDVLGRSGSTTCIDWRLNERHYGALTGLSKEQAALEHGREQVQRWRRSFDAVPPLLDEAANRALIGEGYPELPAGQVPRGESLAQVVERVRAYWNDCLQPALRLPGLTLVTAHGNSLRALIKLIEDIPDHAIASLEVANAGATVYDVDVDGTLKLSARLGSTVLTPSLIL